MKHTKKPLKAAATSLSSALLLMLVAFVALAQNDLLKKPFENWKKEEVGKLLADSPWAKTREARNFTASSQPVAGSGNILAVGDVPSAVFSGDPNAVRFNARLRSALPVRQAVARSQRLQVKYDSLSATERTAFDERIKGLLRCPACEQNYIVTVSSSSRNLQGNNIYKTFRSVTLPQIKPYILLANERGEKRELVHFIPPKTPDGEVTFFFPRFDEKGKPLFTPENKKIIFRLNDSSPSAATSFEFDIAKLLMNGEVAF